MKNKIILSLITAVVACVVFVSSSFAQTKAQGCNNTINLPNGSFIYKQSAPLRSGGIGTPIVGFRIEPTLIMNRPFVRGSIGIYGKNGVKLASCPWASAHGHSGGRARCTINTRSLRNAAKRNGGVGGYFKLGGTCASVPDFGRCYGSVKGLCNRLIS
jgi:hypothetical protein